MDIEKRKLYNKEYYLTNKTILLSKACSNVICPMCDRTVKYCNLKKHTTTKLCISHRSSHESLSEKFEQLLLKMNELENKNKVLI